MTRGLVLGKSMPPHAGHLHLVQVAQSLSDRLTVLVATHPEEPMDGALRYRWMQELCPGCDVVHVHRDLPQLPHEHPRFWEIWVQVVTEAMGGRPDRVFAGESYGDTLAQKLGAAFIPVPRTEGLAISGTEVRAHPRRHWNMIPPPVRSHYATRVRVVGPESSGKTTLSRALAERFDGTWVAEFARGYLEARSGQLVPADLPVIARGQAASEDHLARLAGPLLITDTRSPSDLLVERGPLRCDSPGGLPGRDRPPLRSNALDGAPRHLASRPGAIYARAERARAIL